MPERKKERLKAEEICCNIHVDRASVSGQLMLAFSLSNMAGLAICPHLWQRKREASFTLMLKAAKPPLTSASTWEEVRHHSLHNRVCVCVCVCVCVYLVH